MIRGWIFDLDGTLTIAQHDFGGFKRRLGLPAELAVLEGIAARPTDEQPGLLEQVRAWELALADRARPSPGAAELLAHLEARGLPCGVLTRNSRANAWRTLAAVGLAHRFSAQAVIGRDDTPPKPAPDGVRLLATGWGLAAEDVVVVGDFRFDIQAARAAGAAAVWLDVERSGVFSALADRVIHSLAELIGWDGEPSLW